MTEYYHRYDLNTKLYCGSTDDITDVAYGYTQTDFPPLDDTVDIFDISWKWNDDHWQMISIEEYNRIINL